MDYTPKDFAERKGQVRIVINSFLNAFCIALLAYYLNSDETGEHSFAIILQLVVSIPVLFTSSLLYTKVAYRPHSEYFIWNRVAWHSHTIGYFALMNAIFLTVFDSEPDKSWLAWTFLGITIFLTLVYAFIDVYLKFERIYEKIWKESLYVLYIYSGSVVAIYGLRTINLGVLGALLILIIIAGARSYELERSNNKNEES
ncbi:hypothetical protein [Roseivirga pacifica]|jgi:hypothetical protein|uniref:hypothetical protein n=1 Tax=Roseivirga pacifica TaxID=1267423 RepID=UPI003BAC3C99